MKPTDSDITASTIKSLLVDCLASEVADELVFRCRKIAGRNVYVGCDAQRDLIALLPPLRAPSRLTVNAVQFEGRLEVQWEDQILDRATMSVLRYAGGSSDGVEVFAHVIASVLLGTVPSDAGEEYGSIIEAWLEMLASSHEPAIAEIVGLWGELLVITCSSNPLKATQSWQWRDTEEVDFQYRGTGLEIKTSLTEFRRHTMGLGQYRLGYDLHGLLASVKVREDPDGASVLDLMDRVVGMLSGDSASTSKVVSAVARRLGFGYRVRQTRLNYEAAADEVRYYEWSMIPAPHIPLGVIDANWIFDLSAHEGRESTEVAEIGSPLSDWIGE